MREPELQIENSGTNALSHVAILFARDPHCQYTPAQAN